MKKTLLALLVLVAVAACSDQAAAERALSGAGYREVQITGFRWTGCSDSDEFATGFKAVGPSGQQVWGVVCSGVFKGATIRTD